MSLSEDLDSTLINLLNKKVADDASTKTLQRMKTINLVALLAGSKKKDIVTKRKKHTKSAMKSISTTAAPKDEL